MKNSANGVEVIFEEFEIVETKPDDPYDTRTHVRKGFFRIERAGTEIYQDPGVYVTDNALGSLDVKVEKTDLAPDSGVDFQYRITYQAQDSIGNLSSVLERTIKVHQGPQISLNGTAEIVIVNRKNETETDVGSYSVPEGYSDKGVTALDFLGTGKLSDSNIRLEYVYYDPPDSSTSTQPTAGQMSILSESPDKLKEGILLDQTRKYVVTYSARDDQFNESQPVSRIIHSVAAEDPPNPPIVTPRRGTPNGSEWEVTLDVNATGSGTYDELGATARKTRHPGLGLPYEVSQSWDENNASSIGVIAPVGNVPFVFGKGVGTAVEDSLTGGSGYDSDLSPKFPYVVTYTISDEFEKLGTATLKVRMQDLIKPSIVPDAFAGGATDTLTIEANASYVDPGFTASDNYYSNGAGGWFSQIDYYSQTSVLKRTITDYAKDGSDTPHDANEVKSYTGENTDLKTWNLTNFGKFYVRYTLTDPSGNTADFNRTITVIDTTGPIMTLIGPDRATSTDADPLILPQNVTDASSSYIEYGVNVTDNSMVGSQYFPGEGTLSSIKVEIDDSNVKMDVPGQYKVTYTATDSSGNPNNPEVGEHERTVLVLDKEQPLLDASVSEGNSSFAATSTHYVVAEGGVQYDDDSGQTVKLWNGFDYNTTAPQALTLSANDAQDGVITSRIKRTVSRYVPLPVTPLGFILNNDVASVPSLIDTSSLDAVYEIQYDVDDTADPSISGDTENAADPLYRRIIVKDTMAPSIQPSSFETTVLVDYKSTANPNVSDPADVKNFLVNGFSAVDANDFDQDLGFEATDRNGDLKWSVTFDPEFVLGAIYPETRNDHGPGYKITIKVSDYSGNVSDEVVRYLKVGDFTPPTLTMMGKSEIHDFFRFGKNDTANTYINGVLGGSGTEDNRPFVDRNYDTSTNPDYNATGFGGGAHRMMLAEYNFTDPGVYAEDENADWAFIKGYPDLNGNGFGEGFATVRVADRADMDSCSRGAGLIHVYSFMEQSTSAKKIKHWQSLMKAGTFGYNTSNEHNATFTPAKVPDVDDEDTTINRGVGNEYEFLDLNKSDLTNFDMTIITIEYRVKDHWDNSSSIATRLVYFYESRQFGNHAFYATPLTDAGGKPFEDYDNNESVGMNPVLSGARKDHDGDGVSDFWEFALGTDPENANDTPDFTEKATFISNGNLEEVKLKDNLGRMNAAGRLTNTRGIQDFNAIDGL
ncbi:MAG: hypothetical protein OSB19_17970 [Opitutaceae bacterium]|nr:hypothetical protein [Opitutaceae bacterium]